MLDLHRLSGGGGKDVFHLVGMCMVVRSFLLCRDVISVVCSSSVRDPVMLSSLPAWMVLLRYLCQPQHIPRAAFHVGGHIVLSIGTAS